MSSSAPARTRICSTNSPRISETGANRAFTQEDPIGIAGGLNLYGYANGDPVNFSDPFGLSACDEHLDEDGRATMAWVECKGEEYAEEEAAEAEQAQRAEESRRCLAASVEMGARIGVDVVVSYSWLSGLQAFARGARLVAEGAAISTRLIQTATVNGPGRLGGLELVAGRSMMAGGVGTASLPQQGGAGVSLFPINAMSFIDSHRSACGH